MNKYLLLRDNKQSGPYTIPEIIEIGIKPYDLVWLDGKSISWRYPSEIEDLKAYAPVVEEQPFDRFYKKPEQIIHPIPVPVQTIQHSAYVPKIENTVEEIPQQKKVYINFPVGNAPAKKPIPEKKVIVPEPPQPVYQPVSFTEKTTKPVPERIPSYNSKPAADKKYIYYAGAACVVFIGLITMLLINNNNQQQRLQELNTIVKEIENKKTNDITTQVKNVDPAPDAAVSQTSETIVNPELLSSTDYNTPVKPAVTETVTPPVEKIPAPKKSEQAADESGVVFKEKERPVLRRSDNDQSTASTKKESTGTETVSASENIFKQVSLSPNKYKTGVLGGISNLQLQLTNNSSHELHKVAIQIKYLGPEKKVVNTQTVYFENVSPGEQSTIDVPKSKRGVSIDYTITDIKS